MLMARAKPVEKPLRENILWGVVGESGYVDTVFAWRFA
jgi:hypothetical protein